MKWNGMGEFKALHSLTELARMNAGVQSIDSAILLGESYDTALTTLLESDKNRRLELRFDGIYRHIYFGAYECRRHPAAQIAHRPRLERKTA